MHLVLSTASRWRTHLLLHIRGQSNIDGDLAVFQRITHVQWVHRPNFCDRIAGKDLEPERSTASVRDPVNADRHHLADTTSDVLIRLSKGLVSWNAPLDLVGRVRNIELHHASLFRRYQEGGVLDVCGVPASIGEKVEGPFDTFRISGLGP